jgi:ribulose kinase
MKRTFTLGLDYGTNSVRAPIVDTADGREIATGVWNYEHGEAGVVLSRDPNLARQHPADYIKGAALSIQRALAAASWIELADYVPAALTGTEAPEKLTAGICADGHKFILPPFWWPATVLLPGAQTWATRPTTRQCWNSSRGWQPRLSASTQRLDRCPPAC